MHQDEYMFLVQYSNEISPYDYIGFKCENTLGQLNSSGYNINKRSKPKPHCGENNEGGFQCIVFSEIATPWLNSTPKR